MGEDDLDCDRGMGNYWEPIDQELNADSTAANYGFVAAPHETEPVSPENQGDVAPVGLYGPDETSDLPERRGGDVSQYGGPGRPTGSGDYGPGGPGDSGDDDRYTAPFSEQGGGGDPYDDDRPPFGYQEDERYWTDYLRIAAPVVGVILMLGLVWFWVANMLGGDDEDFDNNNGDETSGPVIDADTPEETADEEEETEEDPVPVTTPDAEETEQDGEGNGEEEETTPTSLGPGATAVVVGTGEEGLNIRESASTEAEVVQSVPDGTEITVTGESEEADGFIWWPIDTGEVTGFVAEDFIELSE